MDNLYNYIPHDTVYNNFHDWKEFYYQDLTNLFSIYKNRLSIYNFLSKENWEDPHVFNTFCRLIYNNSSGFTHG